MFLLLHFKTTVLVQHLISLVCSAAAYCSCRAHALHMILHMLPHPMSKGAKASRPCVDFCIWFAVTQPYVATNPDLEVGATQHMLL